jgi:hypothetical protein
MKNLFKINGALCVAVFFLVHLTQHQTSAQKWRSNFFIRHLENTHKNEVYVLGTLYKRHENTNAYNLEALKKVIISINPQVLVLDVTPEELRLQKVYPGKIEYTNVIFPLVNSNNYRVYPAEPDEPEFSTIVNEVTKAHSDFKKNQPSWSRSLEEYNTSLYQLLIHSWKNVADANGKTTDQLLAAKLRLEGEVIGKGQAESWKIWNRHTTDVVLQALKENIGKRTLVITGIENASFIRQNLKNEGVNLVDMEAWLNKRLL